MTKPSSMQPSRIACLIATSAAVALSSSAMAASPDAAMALARATVPDEVLAPMRGGLDLGTMIARFAIERIVRIDGEVVARTQLLVDRLDGLSRGQLPDARVIGNLANLVQVGDGNHATTAPQSAVQPSPPSAQQTPVSGGTVSTPNVANGLSTEWGTALAQAVAIANGDQSNRPVPVHAAGVPAGGASAAASAASTPGASGAPAPGAGATPGAAATEAVAPMAIPTVSITVPIGAGRIVVSGIPNGPALATSIQNSVQATRIETETRIDAALASLSALRSMNLAAALRQQAIDAASR